MGTFRAVRLALMGGLLLNFSSPAFAAFVVNTDADTDAAGDGACSLREAITAVNNQADYHECISANAGESAVSVAIPPNMGELHTIALTSALPPITHFITLDATGQTGSICTPVPNLRVQITNPAAVPSHGLIFDFGSDFSTVEGLAISGFAPGSSAGIMIFASDVQVGCMIVGTDPAGATAQPNYYGIYVNGQGSTIGVATASQWLPNLISGNSLANIFIDFGGADSVISGNYVGVDSAGATPLQSSFGIYSLGASGVHIGFSDSGGDPAHQRNVIGIAGPPSTNAVNVTLDNATDNVVAGNYIGVSADGQTAVPLGTGLGVSVIKSANSVLGCDGFVVTEYCRNVIANPGGFAVENFEGSNGTAVVGNYIGIGADGVTPFGGSVNAVGIGMSGADTLVARNFISTGGLGNGILLSPNNLDHTTPVFLNQTTAGTNGATLDSSDNCLQGNGAGGVFTNEAGNPTVISTDFISNWWGAADGPAPNGSGDSAASNVNFAPFLTAPSPYCGTQPDIVFRDGFEGS